MKESRRVIASVAKQSRAKNRVIANALDCFVAALIAMTRPCFLRTSSPLRAFRVSSPFPSFRAFSLCQFITQLLLLSSYCFLKISKSQEEKKSMGNVLVSWFGSAIVKKIFFDGKYSNKFSTFALILEIYTKTNIMKSELIKFVENQLVNQKEYPVFKAGDTVTVTYRIVEGNKERLQAYQGVVLQRAGSGATETFTVRKISGGIGVERIFPIASPFIDNIVVNKHGVVRRARIFYLRGLTGKKARIKEKRM
jgi:large subunit ribosomal protein L19